MNGITPLIACLIICFVAAANGCCNKIKIHSNGLATAVQSNSLGTYEFAFNSPSGRVYRRSAGNRLLYKETHGAWEVGADYQGSGNIAPGNNGKCYRRCPEDCSGGGHVFNGRWVEDPAMFVYCA